MADLPADARRAGRDHDDLNRFAQQGSLQFVGNVTSIALTFTLVVVAVRVLGRVEAGAFLAGIGLFQILSTLSQLGAGTGLVRMIPRYQALDRPADVRRLTRLAFVPVSAMGCVVGALVWFEAPLIAHWLTSEQSPSTVLPYIRNLAWFIPLAAISTVALAGTRGYGTAIPSVAIDGLGRPALRLAILTAGVATGLGTLAAVLSYALPVVLGSLAAFCWLLYLERRFLRARGVDVRVATSDPGLARAFWGYSWPRGIQESLSTLSLWLDSLLLAGLRSTAEVAVYTTTTRLMLLGQAALGAIIVVIAPQISRLLTSGEQERAQTLYQVSTWWLMAGTWPVFLSLAWYAPLVLRVFGSVFASGSSVVVILSLANLVNMSTGAAGPVLLMGGHSGLGLGIGAGSVALNTMLNVILIPRLGMNGAAVTWAATLILTNVATVVLIGRLMSLSPRGKGLGVVAIASLCTFGLTGLAMRLTMGTSALSFVVFAAVAGPTYGLVLHRFRGTLHLGDLRRALRARRAR